MTRGACVVVVLASVALASCKDEASRAAPVASASVSNSASAIASASTSAAPRLPVTYQGSYTATAGTLYVPDAAAWDGFKFRGDTDAGALGDGKLTLTIDPDGGVTGDLEGPLGPANVAGLAQENSVSFNVAPKEPKGEMSFSGTGTGTIADGGITGAMHVSSWRANVLREATFDVKRPK
jgi:hypothetical protein